LEKAGDDIVQGGRLIFDAVERKMVEKNYAENFQGKA
jgi:hypothetical protein